MVYNTVQYNTRHNIQRYEDEEADKNTGAPRRNGNSTALRVNSKCTARRPTTRLQLIFLGNEAGPVDEHRLVLLLRATTVYCLVSHIVMWQDIWGGREGVEEKLVRKGGREMGVGVRVRLWMWIWIGVNKWSRDGVKCTMYMVLNRHICCLLSIEYCLRSVHDNCKRINWITAVTASKLASYVMQFKHQLPSYVTGSHERQKESRSSKQRLLFKAQIFKLSP